MKFALRGPKPVGLHETLMGTGLPPPGMVMHGPVNPGGQVLVAAKKSVGIEVCASVSVMGTFDLLTNTTCRSAWMLGLT